MRHIRAFTVAIAIVATASCNSKTESPRTGASSPSDAAHFEFQPLAGSDFDSSAGLIMMSGGLGGSENTLWSAFRIERDDGVCYAMTIGDDVSNCGIVDLEDGSGRWLSGRHKGVWFVLAQFNPVDTVARAEVTYLDGTTRDISANLRVDGDLLIVADASPADREMVGLRMWDEAGAVTSSVNIYDYENPPKL